VRQAIRGYADGIIATSQGGGSSLADLASELSGVSGILAGSDDLKRALADSGVPAESRRALLADLFGSRVSAVTMELVSFALDADRAAETVADIEWLAERFDAAAHQMAPVGDIVLGHKAAEERLDGYATAILRHVDAGRALAEVEDELFRFSRVVAGNEQLSAALSSRDYPVSARHGLVVDLLKGKAGAATTLMAAYATQVGRPRDYQVLLDSLVTRVAAESNRRLAEVRSAVEMDDQQQAKLAEALSRAVGHGVEIRVAVDPSVIAGFVATIGDTVVDASARHQLEVLKERLVLPEVAITTGESA
jgi:F-type H+-transporting ATPase subunit delta